MLTKGGAAAAAAAACKKAEISHLKWPQKERGGREERGFKCEEKAGRQAGSTHVSNRARHLRHTGRQKSLQPALALVVSPPRRPPLHFPGIFRPELSCSWGLSCLWASFEAAPLYGIYIYILIYILVKCLKYFTSSNGSTSTSSAPTPAWTKG